MKKLFISCPMKGRTEENIKKSMDKMHKLAEIMFEQELEVIPTFIEKDAPDNANSGLWYLGRSLQMLAEADYFISVRDTYYYYGCEIEGNAACHYGIQGKFVEAIDVMPDFDEIAKSAYAEI